MGKGSKWRATDYKKYFNNWEKIKKTEPQKNENTITIKNGKKTYKY